MSNPQAADLTAPTFNEFPPTPYEEWRKVVDKFLKGAPFEKRLVTKTYENIDLQPMYRQEDIEGLPHLDSLPGFAPYLRGATPLGYVASSWDVAQELPYATPAAFNAALRADLARGQNAVNLVLDRPTLAGIDADQAEADDVGKGGLSISSVADLAQALDGADLENTPLYIQASTSALTFTALLAALVQKQGKSLAKVRGAIGMDPLGQLARDGRLPRDLDGIYDVMAQLAAWAKANAPHLQTMTVKAVPTITAAPAPRRNSLSRWPRRSITFAPCRRAVRASTTSPRASASPCRSVPTFSWKSPGCAPRGCCGPRSSKRSAATKPRRR